MISEKKPIQIETHIRESFRSLLGDVHAPVSVDDLWPSLQTNPVCRDIIENWSAWTESDRERRWADLCREMERTVYGSRPHCLRCGDCCQKGSPILYDEDIQILRKGVIRRRELLTLRPGEIGYSNMTQGLVLLAEERIKIKEKPGGRECLFLDPKTRGCRIYEDRPRQCRIMECWNPDNFKTLDSQNFLSRKELLNPDDPLVPVIESHTKRCSVFHLQQALSRIKKGISSGRDEALEMLLFDQHLREYLDREQGIAPENQLFLFGRPTCDLIRSFGFSLEKEGEGKIVLGFHGSSNQGPLQEV
jgi:Fe-S-cluster containining protein